MTTRAMILGLLGVVVVSTVAYFNDGIMRNTYFVGNNMPISVYGALILFLLLVNPIAQKISRKLAMSGSELAVVLVIVLAGCWIPTCGLLRAFIPQLVMPFHIEKTNVEWQSTKILDRVPPKMLVTVNSQNKERVVTGYVQGGQIGGKHIRVRDVPWDAYVRPLLFWMPPLLLLVLALLGLSIVLHRQWASHEQLPYPVATFVRLILPTAKGLLSEALQNRLFWIGFVCVAAIHLNNYACVWYKDLVPISLKLDFSLLSRLFPNIVASGGASYVLQPTLFFAVAAFAYFLATDVSLSLAIGPVLHFWVVGILIGYGWSIDGGRIPGSYLLGFGSFVAAFLVVAYTGRRFYWQTLKSAILMCTHGTIEPSSLWGARIFTVAILSFVIYLSTAGSLDWTVTIIFTFSILVTYVVLSRMMAECGLFYITHPFHLTTALVGLFGIKYFSPQIVLLTVLFSMVFLWDIRESFMPIMVNSFKLLDVTHVGIGKIALLSACAVMLALGVSIPVNMYLQYDFGANMFDSWATQGCPPQPYDDAINVQHRLEATGELKLANSLSSLSRITYISADRTSLLLFILGAGLVFAFTFARLRFTWWPLHPVLFLAWWGYAQWWFALSFGVGWAIKVAVTKYGGAKSYLALRPLMIGLAAGELAAGFLTMVIGGVYYLITSQPPVPFNIYPP